MKKSVMKAVVKQKAGPGLSLMDVPIPEPAAGEVLVKVRYASVCGTDALIYGWEPWAAARVLPPRIIGHEFAGEVVETGHGVDAVKTGTRVSAESHFFCGRCSRCRSGYPEVCTDVRIMGVDADGAFAEYLVVPARNLWVNPPEIPDRFATMQEPLGNAVDTVNAEDVSGKTLLVTGAGPMGLMCAAVAKACGAALVIISDPNEYRLKLAEKMGADIAVSPVKEDLAETVYKATGGNGADALLEISGNENALTQGLKLVTPGGRASLLGIFHGPVNVDLNDDVIFKKVRIYGITGRKVFSTWQTLGNLLSSGRLDLEPLITHEMPLKNFEKGFKLMNSGKCGKVIFKP